MYHANINVNLMAENVTQCKNLKEHNAFERDYIQNPSTCICKNGEYLASFIDDSVITYDEIANTK